MTLLLGGSSSIWLQEEETTRQGKQGKASKGRQGK